ncbi:MAG: BMC domain-containing protein [Anaerolineales bacterium]|nr:BMC domain-containing protein [Anaerolineales bacterium]
MNDPALALLEFKSIAGGIEAGDAMVKHAPVDRIVTGTVQPGHFLVMVTGAVAVVEEAVKAGIETGNSCLLDHLFLPNVHPGVVDALAGKRFEGATDALGIVETHTVASAINAADAGLKGADVVLVQLRLADGLGGKGLTMFHGVIADVEAAVEIGTAVTKDHLLRHVIISQLHTEMWENVNRNGRFGEQFNWPQ